jgi:DNA topoisomerase-2
MASASQYTKYSHREHVLELPDTYIGSVDTSVEARWIYNKEKNEMERQTVRFCPGFLKIFDELLVNARDQMVRQKGRIATGLTDGHPVKHIDVVLSDTTISVKNDGDGIPVDKHAESGVYAPELIDHTDESIKICCDYKRDFYTYEISHGIREQLCAT